MNIEFWISVDRAMPVNSEQVLITDGVDISTAYWFSQVFNPRTREVLPGEWANQHCRLTGGYIKSPTYWMPINSLLELFNEAHPPQ